MKRLTLRLTGILALTALAWPAAQSQQVFRIVGPDGRVTFADQPAIATTPGARASAPLAASPAAASASAAATATALTTPPAFSGLPFELRQIATRFPVTIYTGANCNACISGKTMLSARGIPFLERTVDTPEDSDALQKLSGENTLPFLTIGSQQFKGFSESDWGQYLDAAGYPRSSQLPSSYRQPASTPLVANKRPTVVAPPVEVESSARPIQPLPAPPPPSNPAGIRF